MARHRMIIQKVLGSNPPFLLNVLKFQVSQKTCPEAPASGLKAASSAPEMHTSGRILPRNPPEVHTSGHLQARKPQKFQFLGTSTQGLPRNPNFWENSIRSPLILLSILISHILIFFSYLI